ncbi:MAG: hypothetical protein KDA66_05225, partial [Planctomycetaceae bacterium]|nr:hypothetical protein [Planctomycetaceae bacterium]
SLPPSVQFGQAGLPSQLLHAGAQLLHLGAQQLGAGLQHFGAQQLGAGAQQLGAGLQQPVWRTRTTWQQRVWRTGRQQRAASAEPTETNNMAATATALKIRLITLLLQHPRGEGT